jgi:hypothetical protein
MLLIEVNLYLDFDKPHILLREATNINFQQKIL